MKKIIIIAKLLIVIAVLNIHTACSDDNVEVVTQDTSWKIDQKYIDEDIREQLDLDPYMNLVYLTGYTPLMAELNAEYNLGNVLLPIGTEVIFKAKITSLYNEDIVLKLVRDDELMGQFPVPVKNALIFPEENYTLDKQVLKAGSGEVTFKMNLKNINSLNSIYGYALALRLVMEGTHEKLQVAKTRFAAFVKMNVKVKLDNIDSSNAEIEGALFNENLTFETNDMPSKLGTLNDGKLNTYWWTLNELTYLNIVLSERTLIKGIKINTSTSSSGSYSLKSMKVLVDKGNGIWIDHGLYDRSSTGGVVYVKFKSPTECLRIRFESMHEFGKSVVDIYEINLIKN